MAVLSSAPLQFVTSIPPVTRAFTAATVIASLVYYWLWWTSDKDFSVPYLVLVPGSSLFYPWTFVTSAFVETSVFEVCIQSFKAGVFTHWYTAIVHPPCDTSLSTILGATMGCNGDLEVHRCYRRRFQHNCFRPKLAGISGSAKPNVPVSASASFSCIPELCATTGMTTGITARWLYKLACLLDSRNLSQSTKYSSLVCSGLVSKCVFDFSLYTLSSRADLAYDAILDFAHGLRDSVDRHVHNWLPKPLDCHPVWLAGQLGVAALLQKEHGRHWWQSHVRR